DPFADDPTSTRALEPPAPEDGEHDEGGSKRSDQPRQQERRDPVADQQVGDEAKREGRSHQPSLTRIWRSGRNVPSFSSASKSACGVARGSYSARACSKVRR